MIHSILLTVGGFLLLVAEVFFPSLGVFGVSAVACFAGGAWMAWHEVGTTWFWLLVSIQVVAGPLVLRAAFKILPRLPFGRGMILSEPPPAPSAGVEASGHLLGREGVAETDLRPGGTARFGDERRSVVSDAGLVRAGSEVVVTAVEGYRIAVRLKS